MTDDRANPVDSQKPMPNNSNTDSSNTNSDNANSASANSTNTDSSTVNSSAARPAAKAASAPEPQIKKGRCGDCWRDLSDLLPSA